MAEVAKPEFVVFARNAVIVAWLLTLAACGPGDGQGLDENGNLLVDAVSASDDGDDDGGDIQPGDSGNPNATLEWVQSRIFGGICKSCHQGNTAPMGVDWSTAAATCSNIDRDSGEIATLKEIVSGDPDRSYVVWKIEGAGPNGEAIVDNQMPLFQDPLSDTEIKNIKDWISDGTLGCDSAKQSASNKAGNSIGGAIVAEDGHGHSEGSWLHVWETSLRVCSTCHSVRPSNPACLDQLECPPRGLVLDADNYYGIIDGRTVVPFDPESSTLWSRVSTSDPGRRMPPDGYFPLSQYQQDVIRDWILDGAPAWPDPDD